MIITNFPDNPGKISLFTSLLKEYIPGKKLRAARREKYENTESEKLKLNASEAA